MLRPPLLYITFGGVYKYRIQAIYSWKTVNDLVEIEIEKDDGSRDRREGGRGELIRFGGTNSKNIR